MPETYERAYPWIPWRVPLRVETPRGTVRYACRLCVAGQGLRVEDVVGLWETREAVAAHLAAHHADEPTHYQK
jgi:hypothetical protein